MNIEEMKQNELYAVFKEGVYSQQCVGIFYSLDKANSVAKEWAETDEDDYHTYMVYPFQLNETIRREITFVRGIRSVKIHPLRHLSSFRKGETNHD